MSRDETRHSGPICLDIDRVSQTTLCMMLCSCTHHASPYLSWRSALHPKTQSSDNCSSTPALRRIRLLKQRSAVYTLYSTFIITFRVGCRSYGTSLFAANVNKVKDVERGQSVQFNTLIWEIGNWPLACMSERKVCMLAIRSVGPVGVLKVCFSNWSLAFCYLYF